MAQRYRLLLILLLLSAQSLDAQIAPVTLHQTVDRQAFESVFSSSFIDRAELRLWDKRPARRFARLIRDSSGNSLLQVRSKGSNKLLERDLPLNLVAGRKLLIRLRLASSGIRGRVVAYNGVKVALRIVSPAGDTYPQLSMPDSNLAWQGAGFTAWIPPDASSCTLLLGLEGVSGEALFDDLSVSLIPQSDTNRQILEKHGNQMLRGSMIGPYATAQDLRDLASWGANHIRWEFIWDGFPFSSADYVPLHEYRTWLRGRIYHLKSLMPLCDSLGLHVLLDLHTLPGGRRRDSAGQDHRIFSDKEAQSAFREIWEEMAVLFKSEPALWGYDLANEPVEGYLPDSLMDWQQLASATASDILAVDSAHHILLQGAPGGSPQMLPGIIPLNNMRTIYSFHFYEPTQFTHQGVYGLDTGIHYPGMIGGQYWDKATLRKVMQPVRDWQLKYGLSIYVGEFSVIRWAPDSSGYNYLRDCIDIFEEWGWSWAYHTFREWDGWSVEHGSNPTDHERSPTPTLKQRVLMDAFKKNAGERQ